MDPESKEEDVYLATFRAKATVAVAVYGHLLIFSTLLLQDVDCQTGQIRLPSFGLLPRHAFNLNPLYEKPVRVARLLPSFPFSRLCPTQVNPLILIHVK